MRESNTFPGQDRILSFNDFADAREEFEELETQYEDLEFSLDFEGTIETFDEMEIDSA